MRATLTLESVAASRFRSLPLAPLCAVRGPCARHPSACASEPPAKRRLERRRPAAVGSARDRGRCWSTCTHPHAASRAPARALALARGLERSALPRWRARACASPDGVSPLSGAMSGGQAEEEDVGRVLAFWFDGDTQENFKRKWFPTSGATDSTQVEVDRVVTEEFGALLRLAEQGGLRGWGEGPAATPRSATALIVVLDQFSRHVYRHADRARIEANDQMALALANSMMERGWEKALPVPFQLLLRNDCEELSVAGSVGVVVILLPSGVSMLNTLAVAMNHGSRICGLFGNATTRQPVFIMMPLRHTPTVDRLRDVMGRVAQLDEAHQGHAILLDKFRRQTLRRLQDLEGKQWKTGDEILEFHPFDADETQMPRHALYKAVDHFLQVNNARSFPALTISLSGGVDSMVLAKLLVILSPRHGNFQVVACHIDYANRPESGSEAQYVSDWCDKLGIRFVQRRIEEITRGVTARDEYEELSRRIRYGFYLDVMQEVNSPAMLLGHHKGDVQENIISNMFKGKSLLQINGMGPTSIISQVTVWRPMLIFNKDAIFDFAHTYGIPYFKDTTPKWSTRGKLRNQLMPLLQDMYGEGYLQNLSGLGEDADQLTAIMNRGFLQPFWDRVHSSSTAVWVDCAEYVHQPVFFWKEALRHVCHSMGTGMFKDKPLLEFMERIKRPDKTTGGEQGCEGAWITLKKGNRTMLNRTVLIIYRSEFFPKVPYVPRRTPVKIGTTFSAGPWTVTTNVIPAEDTVSKRQRVGEANASSAEDVDGNTLQPKTSAIARVTLQDVLTGAFVYELVARAGETLVVDPKVRALAFRGLDPGLRSALPVVVREQDSADCEKGRKPQPLPPLESDVRIEVSCKFSGGGAASPEDDKAAPGIV